MFFEDLKIPRPDIDLGIGSDTHAAQTGKILIAFDAVLEKLAPDLVVVVGDVNSTIACALAAKKRGIKVAHVEAGLRSFDWEMPEEINRVLTDRLSDFLFVSEPSALKNLKREGIDMRRVFFVGNVMIDTLLRERETAERSPILRQLGLMGKKFALVTLHRPSNVDEKKNLANFMKIFSKVTALNLHVIFPVHPRTEKNLKKWHIQAKNVTLIPPLGYLDFLKLMSHSSIVLTDSGGIQEETTILGIPCLTLRKNTERPVTVTSGTNKVVGGNEAKILKAVRKILAGRSGRKIAPKFWDGKAAERIAKILKKSP